MNQFKRGQIVYVSNDQKYYHLCHFVDYKHNDAYPYKISNDYQEAIKGVESSCYGYCLSVEDYQKMLKQPKDKDLVWAWDDEIHFARTARFYDARNNGTFYPSTGARGGYNYDNYEVIPREQWLEWAIEAYERLED